jgi:protein-disulfide isomerase/uncharacterized membrane protein
MKKISFWIGCVASFLAVGVHCYLLNLHYNLKYGQMLTKSICNFNDVLNCEATAASRYAEFLGVPLALWGLLANLVLLGYAFRWFFASPENQKRARSEVLFIAGFIALASVVMGSISAFALGTYCLMCIVTYLLSFWGLAGFYYQKNGGQQSALNPWVASAKAFLITGICVFILGFVLNTQAQAAFGARDLRPFVESQIAEWENNPQMTIATSAGLILGAAPEKAKFTIVEFADFLCPHCRHAAPVLHAFVLAHASDTRMVFQAWPLDGECNTSVQQSDGLRCGLARLVYCAEKKGKGWLTYDWIYGHQDDFYDKANGPSLISKMSQETGQDEKDLNQCASSDEAKEAIVKQAALGTSLKIQGTPSIFVNGKQLPSGQYLPVLQEAYAHFQNPK